MNTVKATGIARALVFRRIKLDAFTRNTSDIVVHPPDEPVTHLPRPTTRENEDLQQRKSRLIYQSRKRGMLENDLLLSTFVAKHLEHFTAEQVDTYDKLINGPSNDWDIYYWACEVKEIPGEYHSDVMQLLKLHCKNLNRESRIRQPDL